MEYFAICKDRENDAYLEKGQYLTISGRVLNVNQHRQELKLLSDGNTYTVQFADIYRVSDPTSNLF